MKHNKINTFIFGIILMLGMLLNSGCTTWCPWKTTEVEEETVTTTEERAVETKKAVVQTTSGYGPSYTTYDKKGVTYKRGSMAFPTGNLSSSTVLLEKSFPAEVMVGQRYNYRYTVKNLLDYPITNVELKDIVKNNFDVSKSKPAADSVNGNEAVWLIGDMAAGEKKTIIVYGSSAEEGMTTSCGIVTFNPILCEGIKVVKANLELVKQSPKLVTICDNIPYSFKVRNSGSSRLTDVIVTDPLPKGIQTLDGKTSLKFDAGTLEPGESKDFNAEVRATSTGKFENTAKASCAQGVEAEDSSVVVVKAPALALSCDAPKERFIGRPVSVCFNISNTGNTSAKNTVVTMPLPSGASFQGATAGGRLEGENIIWDIGSLPAEGNREVCANFTGAQAGKLRFKASATADCAEPTSSTCRTKVVGIPAILLEVIDLEDPIEVGATQTYEITVTNQGSAPATGVKITCEIENAQSYVSTSGATSATNEGSKIMLAPVKSIAPKEKVAWRIIVKAVESGDIRFHVSMESDQISRPVSETEATNQY